MKGRSLACFSRSRVAWTSSCASASSGRCCSPGRSGRRAGRRRGPGGGPPRAARPGRPRACGSSTSRRTSSAEATSSSPTAASIALRRRSQLGQAPAVVGLQARAAPGVGGGELGEGLGVAGGLAGDGQPTRRPAGGRSRPRRPRAGRRSSRPGARPGWRRRPAARPAARRSRRRSAGPRQAVQRGEAGPRRRRPGSRWPAPAVAPRNSELRLIVWTWPVTVWTCPSCAIPGRSEEEAGQPERPGLLQVGDGLQTRWRAMAMSRSRAAGQPQRAGQVDRLDDLARDECRIDGQAGRWRRRYGRSLRFGGRVRAHVAIGERLGQGDRLHCQIVLRAEGRRARLPDATDLRIIRLEPLRRGNRAIRTCGSRRSYRPCLRYRRLAGCRAGNKPQATTVGTIASRELAQDVNVATILLMPRALLAPENRGEGRRISPSGSSPKTRSFLRSFSSSR